MAGAARNYYYSGTSVIRGADLNLQLPKGRLAMGTFTACLDLALGVGGPELDLIAGGAGLGTVFLVSALVAIGAAAVALRLLRAPPSPWYWVATSVMGVVRQLPRGPGIFVREGRC